jgi:hypothetical protein
VAIPQVTINDKDYYVEPRRNGFPVEITANPSFIEAQSQVGGQSQAAIQGRSTRILGPWTSGHGYNRIPEKEDLNPTFLKGFWDNGGCQTWFDGDARLPILEENSTHTGLEVIRASAHFQGNMWSLWEDDTGTDIVARKYDADAGVDVNFTAGGSVVASANELVALDLMQHKDKLVALVANTNDHVSYDSTDGATWTTASGAAITLNLLSNVVTVHEDIDAGLLATVGEEAIAILWNEAGGAIAFSKSTDKAETWADQAGSFSSGNGPQGVGVMAGIDNADKLYTMSREGLWETDTSGTYASRIIYPMTPHNDNGRRMVVHNGALYFAQGVDDDSPAPVIKMINSDGVRRFETNWGLDVRDSVPDDMLGPIRWMRSVGNWLIASLGGGEGRKARVMIRDTTDFDFGWHTVRPHGTANEKIEWIDYSADDDGTPRLHYSVRTDTAVSNAKFLAQLLTNPQSGVTAKREATGTITMPEFDGGMATTTAAWIQQRTNVVDLSSSTSGEYVNANYGVNGAARTTDLGNFLSGTKTLKHASGAGVEGISYGVSLDFHRDATTNTHTPKVRSLEVVYHKNPTQLITARFTIDVAKQLHNGQMVPAKKVRTQLETARDLGTLVSFKYIDLGEKFVRVRLLSSRERPVQHSGGGEGASNTLWIRDGLIEVECEEIAG